MNAPVAPVAGVPGAVAVPTHRRTVDGVVALVDRGQGADRSPPVERSL